MSKEKKATTYKLNEKTGELIAKMQGDIQIAQSKLEAVILAIRLEKGIDPDAKLSLSQDFKTLTVEGGSDGS